jgi:hypothetical protein
MAKSKANHFHGSVRHDDERKLACGSDGSSPMRKLVSLTSPERKAYENMQLQQWREQEAFDAKISALEAERDALKRTTMALG